MLGVQAHSQRMTNAIKRHQLFQRRTASGRGRRERSASIQACVFPSSEIRSRQPMSTRTFVQDGPLILFKNELGIVLL